ncbi:glycoside hydrolase family 28 protein [Persicobacter diffluens]|uniref:Glycoside hydrolase n=1 Tax=Persicobacter diffluens TaxID=981 RepID=A0AAN5APE0_9BACT|nr:glycoside hydrolase [Persicobacter diffluens]
MQNLVLFIGVLFITIGCQPPAHSGLENSSQTLNNQFYQELEFPMEPIAAPQFSDYSVNILEFGAQNDGISLNTEAINKSIDKVHKSGGGTVVIPRGMWLTGPIVLKSNVRLHTEYGAFILFSDDFSLYPLQETSFEGLDTYRCQSPISALGAENIAITGHGIFDGNGDRWRPVKKSKMTANQWKKLLASGGILNEKKNIWYPTEKAKRGDELSTMNVPENLNTLEEHQQIHEYLRPVLVSIVKSRNILLDGPTFQNSPAWNIHPLMCENLIVRNLTVRNPWYSQNGDGIDIESCKNVLVNRCNFDVGDDAICIKSGKDADGRRRGIPTENLVVIDNVVYHGHGGVVVGSEMSGGVRNVHVSNCTFIGTDVGLRFKSTRGRGGKVENIFISNVEMKDIPAEAIRFNMYYTGKSPVAEPEEEVVDLEALKAQLHQVNDETPIFRNIHVNNVVCRGAHQAIALQGLPEMNLAEVYMTNIDIAADKGLSCFDADGIYLKNVKLSTRDGIPFMFHNSKNIMLENAKCITDQTIKLSLTGPFTENIKVKNSDISEKEVSTSKSIKGHALVL